MYKCFEDIECSDKMNKFYSIVNKCFADEINSARDNLGLSVKNTIECDASKWNIKNNPNDVATLELFMFYVLYELKKSSLDIVRYDNSFSNVADNLYNLLTMIDDITSLTVNMSIENIYNYADGEITYLYHLIIPSSSLIDQQIAEKAEYLAEKVNLNIREVINREFIKIYKVY